jgi:hypothetical protein
MTSLRTSSFVKHDHLAAPGVVLPGLLGRFTERGRRVLATEDFAELVATIRSGPPPEFFRLRELGLATGGRSGRR